MYLHPTLETMERRELESLQVERLRRAVSLAASTPFYGPRLEAAGVRADQIHSLADLARIPLTSKDDLRLSYPKGMLAAPDEDIVRMHASSGTTGKPTVIFHTAHDLDAWTGLVARSLYGAGMRKHDVFQNMMTYGLFTGGLGLHYGAERVGMMVIPASSGNTRRQVQLIQDFGTTAVHITPSYALHMAQDVANYGVADPRELGLKFAIMGAEPYSVGTARKIEEAFGAKVFNCYGLSEMNGPAVAFECAERNGMHIWEDNYIVEILDPDTLEPAPAGAKGELVLTTINRTGMPILRYRTKDLTRLHEEPCPCGRTHRRIERILGRTDDMMIISGVNVFPSQIEHVLMEMPEVGSTYQ
ncbi:MAG TPA: phenylacetate--CoA ligase, partial [Holophaga sp.]|nr:phenylacetate--CoA ligase [Holophaga sp.]